MTTTSSSTGSSVLSALGLGSGLDIDTMVTELTTAEMQPANNRLERQQASVTAEVSALATLKSALSTFQDSLDALTSGSGFDARSVSSNNEDLLTASADSDAANGTYRVVVQQLAQGQQLKSGNFSDGSSTVVGTGTLTLSVGEESFSVTIDNSSSSLAKIRDAINNASGNTGITATLIYGTDGAQLALTSTKTGADNTITVSASGGNGGLSQLAYSASDPDNYTVEQEAQDAIISIAGTEHHSSSNTVTDAVDGLTLDLQDADPDTTITLTVSNDTEHVESLVQSFISAYNTLITQIESLDSYDSDTGEAGALFGDSMLNTIESRLKHALSDTVSGATAPYNSFASLGITTQDDGTLTLDSDKLESALKSDFSSVSKVLGSSNGVVERMSTFLEDALASDGSIAIRDASLDREQSSIDEEQDQIDARTEQVRQRYLAKFNAMDSLVAELQNTADYLTQQFDALNKDS